MRSDSDIRPGFKDPVHESQSIFRKVLRAMSRPGTLARLEEAPIPPEPFNQACLALLLALADMDTPIWMAHPQPWEQARSFLGFHCGAVLTKRADQAVFAVIPEGSHLPDLDGLSRGRPDRPDTAATLIVQVRDLRPDGPGMQLSGPGIQGTRTLACRGLDPRFFTLMAANVQLYPLGLDCILTAGDRLVCLPRSVRVRPEEVPCT